LRIPSQTPRDAFDQRVNLLESGPRVLPGRPAEVVVRSGKKRKGISQNLQERVILHIVLSNVNALTNSTTVIRHTTTASR
jgi:hypothetical protein